MSGFRGATLLPGAAGSLGFYAAPGCAAHPAYGLACPHKYINLELGGWDWAGGGAAPRATLARTNLAPGRAGAPGLAAQRLPSLAGGQLIPKAGRGGRYWNVAAAANGGSYLVSWGDAAAGTWVETQVALPLAALRCRN